RADKLDAQLEQLRAPGQRAAAERAKAEEYAGQLSSIYAPAGITETDMERAADAWDAAGDHADAYRASSGRLAELEGQRGTAAADEGASLRQLVDDLSRQLGEISPSVDPVRAAEFASLPLAELERQRDQHRGAKERAQEERARAEELLNDRLTQIGDVASPEEEIATAREQVALARIIGGNAEPPPLLLDEALVHADRRRMRAALDELGRLGQDHQIVLFSKDESLADRAEKAADWTIIRLPGPAAAPTPAEEAKEEVPSA